MTQFSNMDAGDRVVVVAGAGGPTGHAVVKALVNSGARVVTADRVPHEWDDERVTPTVVDLLDADATRAWADRTAAEHGRVDGLIHLVGGWRGGTSFGDTDLADWAFLHDLLIRTLQHTTLAFYEHLRSAPGGARVAIVSQHAARHPRQNAAAYATGKAASEAWLLAMADAFEGTASAATILVVEALLNDAMRAKRPDADFTGHTHVDDLGRVIAGLWDRPAAELNGTRIDLAE
ncbi:SDR family oxidoreductase [Actinomadura viridis]|uniref:NAD(P)-dependent dehydrogenase (Short-subunit alcohol dehydrogenase family) n=1 Tax=Actinomadura viridis TaxID=58110 RepID=A0A931DQ78_9ACTN|nr:SDR family NAD(P)-dependent oxidoreductase [Actinomadura viridis]MBG6090713.1 NAD(P)-dependent dehydrogenase (short-subunit alcohol dehydrogenase family) [Actinomadura viridis]